MNPTRYILTRSCIQDGSMRLLKFNEMYFPESGTAQFVDDRGKAYDAYIDRDRMLISGLRELYHDHNLSVNDVLLLTPVAPGEYTVETVVKPYSSPRSRQAPRRGAGSSFSGGPAGRSTPERPAGQAASPSVREVRGQGQHLQPRPRRSGPQGGGRNLSGLGEERRSPEGATPLQPIAPAFAPQLPQGRQELTISAALPPFGNLGRAPQSPPPVPPAPEPATDEPAVQVAQPAARVRLGGLEDQIAEFARLTGYRLSPAGRGLIRLSADLGPAHGYTVLLATEPLATTSPEWEGDDDHRALVTGEEERAPGVPRLTREALALLIEHARLAPLGAIDLRGYWRAGNLDLESAASIAEMVSAHLAQRGAFTYLLLTLSQQPAQSVVNVSELAQRLGSGVSLDDMQNMLETLSRPPFLALTPLPGGQFLLRTGVADLLADLADYAQGVRRRLRLSGQSHATATPVAGTLPPREDFAAEAQD